MKEFATETIRWGILGPGYIARQIAKQLPSSQTGVLVAVGSSDRTRAKDFAVEVGVPHAITGTYEEVLSSPDVDAVYVSTVNTSHAQLVLAAVLAGKHVLVEKPLANTLAEAELMTAVAAKARAKGVQSMIGFNYRRVPSLALARELIAEGKLGTIRHVRASYMPDWLADPESPMTWRLNKETAGSGALGDIASHAIDQVLFRIPADSGQRTRTPLHGRLVAPRPRDRLGTQFHARIRDLLTAHQQRNRTIAVVRRRTGSPADPGRRRRVR